MCTSSAHLLVDATEVVKEGCIEIKIDGEEMSRERRKPCTNLQVLVNKECREIGNEEAHTLRVQLCQINLIPTSSILGRLDKWVGSQYYTLSYSLNLPWRTPSTRRIMSLIA